MWSQQQQQRDDEQGGRALLLRNNSRRRRTMMQEEEEAIAVAQKDRNPLVECDPHPEAASPDIGILTCGLGYYCLESQESDLGGYCSTIGITSATSAHESGRDLAATSYCQKCDCSALVDGVGTIDNCILFENKCVPLELPNPFSAQKACYSTNRTVFYSEPGHIQSLLSCYEDFSPFARHSCKGYNFDGNKLVTYCNVSVEGVPCNSCTSTACNNTDPSLSSSGIIFDCTNTAARAQGSYCEGQFLSPWIVYAVPGGTFSPSPSPSKAPMSLIPETKTVKPAKRHAGAGIAAGIGVPVIAIVAGLLFYLCYHKKKQSGNGSTHSKGQVGELTERGTAGGTAVGAMSGLTSGSQIETVATPVSHSGTEYNDYGPTFKGQAMSVVHDPRGDGQFFHHHHQVQRNEGRIAARQQEMQGDDVPIANAIFVLDKSVVPRQLDP
jgi:hypothetical protein